MYEEIIGFAENYVMTAVNNISLVGIFRIGTG